MWVLVASYQLQPYFEQTCIEGLNEFISKYALWQVCEHGLREPLGLEKNLGEVVVGN